VRRSLTRGAVAILATAAVVAAAAGPASAAGSDSKVSRTTTVGVHNTYDPATFAYLAQALDEHPGLIELDVWPDIITRTPARWCSSWS
jgi:ABC-type glycerol-3-phosphate transport system substrate-binding protein